MHVLIGDTRLIQPHYLSEMCEQTALRVASLDAQYKRYFDELLELLVEDKDAEKISQYKITLASIQQEIKEIFQKVRATSNPFVVTKVCPICHHMKTFDDRDGYCSDCAQGDPIADLEARYATD